MRQDPSQNTNKNQPENQSSQQSSLNINNNSLTSLDVESREREKSSERLEFITIAGIQILLETWNSVYLPYLYPYLSAGPYVEIILGDPSEEQKNRVIAKAQPVPDEHDSNQQIKLSKQEVDAPPTTPPTTTDTLQPVVNAYHLIINKKEAEYFVGFCDEAGKYAIAEVTYRCSLDNYLSGHPTSIDLKDSTITRDPELIRYIQDLIREKKGHTVHPARDTAHFSQANRVNFALFQLKLQKQAFKELLDAVVRSEYDRVEKILKSHPELLRLTWKSFASDKGIAERFFYKTTAFQLAFWAGDWEMLRRMLQFIPEGQETEYKNDLKQQFLDLTKNGLTYILDNLKACGLRILDADPSKNIKDDVCERNAYLFIINKESGDCSLGFKDPETGQYKQCQLDSRSELKNHADELQQGLNHRHNRRDPCYIIRDEIILALARKEIKQHGGHTEITETSKFYASTPLIEALKKLSDQHENWSWSQKIEYWCVIVGWAQRLLPAAVWNWWLNSDPNFNWPKGFTGSLSSTHRPKLQFPNDLSLFPWSPSFGDTYSIFKRGPAVLPPLEMLPSLYGFLERFRQTRSQKLRHLIESLNSTPPTNAKKC